MLLPSHLHHLFFPHKIDFSSSLTVMHTPFPFTCHKFYLSSRFFLYHSIFFTFLQYTSSISLSLSCHKPFPCILCLFFSLSYAPLSFCTFFLSPIPLPFRFILFLSLSSIPPPFFISFVSPFCSYTYCSLYFSIPFPVPSFHSFSLQTLFPSMPLPSPSLLLLPFRTSIS